MSRKAKWTEAIIFLAFIFLFFILNLALPERTFSEQENRVLQTLPSFSFKELFSGKYTADYEKYTTDQFAGRDRWISLKAAAELALGKSKNNDVYLCENDTLIQGFKKPDTEALDKALAAIEKLRDNTSAEVYLALIPSKSELYADLLPKDAPNYSEAEVIEYCYDRAAANCVDLLTPLREHSGEYIYYRTDHHWTSLGAYYAYAAIAEAMGNTPRSLDSYTERRTVSDSFCGTAWSSSGFTWVEPDRMEIFVEPPEGLEIVSYPSGSPVEGKLYDESFLAKKDKYSMFMGGNSPLHEIKTENEGPSLLIVRDSYTDSLIPFLLDDYSNIYVLDLRYYRASLADYIAQHNVDKVLICYSTSNFTSDQNLFLMGR